jgi:hypothetical protein
MYVCVLTIDLLLCGNMTVHTKAYIHYTGQSDLLYTQGSLTYYIHATQVSLTHYIHRSV